MNETSSQHGEDTRPAGSTGYPDYEATDPEDLCSLGGKDARIAELEGQLAEAVGAKEKAEAKITGWENANYLRNEKLTAEIKTRVKAEADLVAERRKNLTAQAEFLLAARAHIPIAGESPVSQLQREIEAHAATKAQRADLEDYIKIMKRTHGQTFAAMRSESERLTARAKCMQKQRDLRLYQLRAKEDECKALRNFRDLVAERVAPDYERPAEQTDELLMSRIADMERLSKEESAELMRTWGAENGELKKKIEELETLIGAKDKLNAIHVLEQQCAELAATQVAIKSYFDSIPAVIGDLDYPRRLHEREVLRKSIMVALHSAEPILAARDAEKDRQIAGLAAALATARHELRAMAFYLPVLSQANPTHPDADGTFILKSIAAKTLESLLDPPAILAAHDAEVRSQALKNYLLRQIEFSTRAFGPGLRTGGNTRHIEKELAEIRANPADLSEWIDVITLACDGYWRHGGKPENLLADMEATLARNITREWPSPKSEDEPVEHIKEPTCTIGAENGELRKQNAELAAALRLAHEHMLAWHVPSNLIEETMGLVNYRKALEAHDAALVKPLVEALTEIRSDCAMNLTCHHPHEDSDECGDIDDCIYHSILQTTDDALAPHTKGPICTAIPGIELSWTQANGEKTTAIFPHCPKLLADGRGRFTALTGPDELDYYRQTCGAVEISFVLYDVPDPAGHVKGE